MTQNIKPPCQISHALQRYGGQVYPLSQTDAGCCCHVLYSHPSRSFMDKETTRAALFMRRFTCTHVSVHTVHMCAHAHPVSHLLGAITPPHDRIRGSNPILCLQKRQENTFACKRARLLPPAPRRRRVSKGKPSVGAASAAPYGDEV